MTKKSTDPSDPGAQTDAPSASLSPAPEPAANTQTAAELAELLRALMRTIGRESAVVTPTPPPPPPAPLPLPLPQEAVDAVEEFRSISADLRVATTFTA